MAEEIKNDVAPVTPEPKTLEQAAAPQLSAVEEKAAAQGWVPQDQWDGDPDAWRPAKEFLDRGELFKKIDEQNKTIKQFKRALDDLAQHHKKVRDVEFARALESLKAQKKEALQDGDADAVIAIDERLAAVRDAQKNAPPPVQVPDLPAEQNPIFVNWTERNSWYGTNKAMKAYADRIGVELAQQGVSPVEILQRVEQEVKKEFAEKFNNPNRNKPGAVEGSTNKGSSKAKESMDLSPEEHRAMERFVKLGVLTKEQYIADLKALKAKGV